MSNENVSIYVSSLKKSYKKNEVLKDVNFSVPSGKIYALLGSNGAGKTTTIRILTTQIKADNGEIKVEGYDVSKEPQKIHEIISLTGQFSAIDETLTGKENLVTMGRLRHIHNPKENADNLLKYFELSDFANQKVSTYSGGMMRKIDIAMSLVGNPSVIFLDEPTTGLDPQSRRSMWDVIMKLNESGVTIFLTTQYLEEAEKLADTIAILDKGRIIAEGTPTELKSFLPQGASQFLFNSKKDFELAKSLTKDYKISFATEENKLVVYTNGEADILAQIFSIFQQNKVSIQNFSLIEPSLEDVFLTMIQEGQVNSYEN